MPIRSKWLARLPQTLGFAGMIACIVWMSGCHLAPIQGSPLPTQELHDGVFEGSYRSGPNRADVRVTIKDHAITSIDVLKHVASWKGHRVEKEIVAAIIAQQSTEVDAVTGATNSSRVIMNAVQAAIDASRRLARISHKADFTFSGTPH